MTTDEPVKWKRLIDMPTETLADRVVGTMILAKGNLNEYTVIIKNLLDSIAKEHKDAGKLVPADLWDDIVEFIELHFDVIDGTDGPRPNRAMQLKSQIDEEVK